MAGGKNNQSCVTDHNLRNNFNINHGMANSSDINSRKVEKHFEKPNVIFFLKFTRNLSTS